MNPMLEGYREELSPTAGRPKLLRSPLLVDEL